MSQSFPSADSLDPQGGFAQSPSAAQAADDLRAAAGEKPRESGDKAAQIKDRALETAQQLRETASERATQLKAAATEKAVHLRESANEQWEDTRVKARELQVSAEDYIRQNPLQCVLGALGAGFIFGLMVRR